jgi:hypothetical protein
MAIVSLIGMDAARRWIDQHDSACPLGPKATVYIQIDYALKRADRD